MKQEIKFTEYQPTDPQKQELADLATKFRQFVLSYGQDPDSPEMQKVLKDRQQELKRIWWLNSILMDAVSHLQLYTQEGRPLQIQYQLTDSCSLYATFGPESLYDVTGVRSGVISSTRIVLDQELALISSNLDYEERTELKQAIMQYYLERYEAHQPVLAHYDIKLEIHHNVYSCSWTNNITGKCHTFGCNAREYFIEFGELFWQTIQNGAARDIMLNLAN